MYLILILFLSTFFSRPNSREIQLLIVGREEVRELAEAFVSYKHKVGIPAVFVSVEDIEQRFQGFDIPEKIRNAVRYYKDNRGIRYLLILGDHYKVPARIAYVRIGSNELSNNVPTDFYYAELYSDWDRNRNGLFGEQQDSISLVPNVMVGRIPYHNFDELRGYFIKMINYKNLADGATKFLLHSSDILQNGTSYKLADTLSYVVPLNFTLSKLYEIGTDTNVAKAQFIDSLSSGLGYIFSCAHGDFGNLYINQTPLISFAPTDIPLVRSSIPAFWSILSCDIGGFDRDALGEHLIFAPYCIGILSQTRDGISNTITFYQKFHQNLFRGPEISVGEADSSMREAFSREARTGLISYYSILTYNLLGDPTLIPIKGRYSEYTISDITIHQDTGVTIRLMPLDSATSRVKKRFVIYKENEVFEVLETEDDSACLRINPKTPGYLYFTITGAEVKDIFDSLYITPYTLPIRFTLESVRNEYGDTILLSNSKFEMTIRVKNSSSKYLDTTAVVLRSLYPVYLSDTFFTISLKPYEEKRISVRGYIDKVAERGVAEFEVKTVWNAIENRELFFVDYYVPVIKIADLRMERDNDSVLVRLKIFNQNFYPLRSIKLISRKQNASIFAFVELLGPYGDTVVSVVCSLQEAYEGFFLCYMRDSLLIPVLDGIAFVPPPTNLTGTPGNGSVTLRWKSPGNGLLFNIYKNSDGSSFRRINRTLVKGVSFVDYEAEGIAYYYVTSVDTLFSAESTPSNVIAVAPNPPYFSGWPQPVLGVGYSTPVVCELDRSLPGFEIVIATFFDSLIYAFDCRGNLLPGWPVNLHGTVLAAVAAGDVDGDGEEEAIVVTRDGTRSLHILDKYGIEKPGFPIYVPGAGFSTPCVCNFVGDGRSEVVIKDGNYIKIFGLGGLLRVSDYLGGAGTSPACGDVDGDGELEIVVSYVTNTSGYIGVLDSALNQKPGFPVLVNKSDISSPSIGDILPDVPGLEIVVFAKDTLYLISSTGSTLSKGYVGQTNSWPYAISPALGDVDGDGIRDIAIPTYSGFKVLKVNGSSFSNIYGAYCGSGFSSCTIFDVDNDRRGEVFKGSVNGYLYAYNSTGQILLGFPIDLFSYAYVTPQIFDVDGDGTYEIVASSWGNNLFVFSTNWVENREGLVWPMYKNDRFRSGNSEFNSGGATATNLGKERERWSNSEHMNCLVYDVAGRLIFKGRKTDFEQKVKNGGLRSGIYFIKTVDQKHLIKRVVIR